MENQEIIQTSSATSRQEMFLPSYLKPVIKKTGAPVKQIVFLAECRKNRIGQMDSMRAKGELILMLPVLAKNYGARYDIGDEVIFESIALIFEKFSFLAVEEIREAYRQYAAGELNLGKEAEMWGGEFTVAQLGKVLTAYSQSVAKIKAEILRMEIEAKEEKSHQERQAKAAAEFDRDFKKMVERMAANAQTWEEVPAFWYEACKRRGWLVIGKEKANEIFEQAKVLAKNEALSNRIAFEKIVISLERAKVIAQKLAVFEWLKNGMK